MIKRIYGLMGLAMKAGKVGYGADMCEEKIKNGEAHLVIIAEDSSSNTKNKFKEFAEKYNIRIIVIGNMEELSASIGKVNKGVFTILDEGFSNKICELARNILGGQ